MAPVLGATVEAGGTRVRVLAPAVSALDVVMEPDGATHPLRRTAGGLFEGLLPGVGAGARYRLRAGAARPTPDPASRFQPEGVHGPSEVVDPAAYRWSDGAWAGLPLDALVLYEAHVGTFTPEGTFAAARARLRALRDLGVTALELMPVCGFPGRWGWGYDPAALFAPASAYGTPDELRALVDEAHRLGLAVLLDLVLNHFSPDGAYAVSLCPQLCSRRHRTPWGAAVNLDGRGARRARAFLIECALRWLREYHLDGLRLDATSALVDEGPTHFLAELSEAVAALGGPPRHLIAEDERNLAHLVAPRARGGYGLDAVWSDDFCHQLRRLLTGERAGALADFEPRSADLARVLEQGWLYRGERSAFWGRPRGSAPDGLAPERFVFYAQNHDQVGNRPAGDRLTAQVGPAVHRAVTALLLFAPQLPLLFMGQEWAASTPFLFFSDHAPPLGQRVAEGRARELRRLGAGAGPLPDPQDPESFRRSKLDWAEAEAWPHRGVLQLHRDRLAARRALAGPLRAESPVAGGLSLRRGAQVLLVALEGGRALPLPAGARVLGHTEEPAYAAEPAPPRLEDGRLLFPRAAALWATLERG